MDFWESLKQLYAVEELQGYEETEIALVKAHFGALPQVVEEFWRRAGRTEAIHHVQDMWMKPEDFQKGDWLRNSDCLILLNENQGCCRAGIRRSDLDKADPPVYVTMDDKNWRLCAETTSEFLLAALSYEAVFTYSFGPEDFVLWLTEEELDIVQTRLEKKPFELHGWIDIDMNMSFYSNAPDNMVVVMDCGELQTIYGAASEESYKKLLEVMEGLGET